MMTTTFLSNAEKEQKTQEKEEKKKEAKIHNATISKRLSGTKQMLKHLLMCVVCYLVAFFSSSSCLHCCCCCCCKKKKRLASRWISCTVSVAAIFVMCAILCFIWAHLRSFWSIERKKNTHTCIRPQSSNTGREKPEFVIYKTKPIFFFLYWNCMVFILTCVCCRFFSFVHFFVLLHVRIPFLFRWWIIMLHFIFFFCTS